VTIALQYCTITVNDLDESVVKLAVGDPIRLTEDQFERLSAAFFAEVEERFVARPAAV
jgi:hypothetical protein